MRRGSDKPTASAEVARLRSEVMRLQREARIWERSAESAQQMVDDTARVKKLLYLEGASGALRKALLDHDGSQPWETYLDAAAASLESQAAAERTALDHG